MPEYNGRPYVEKMAFELQKGDCIWVTTDKGPKLWRVRTNQQDRTTGFVFVECNEGGIMFGADSGVMLDIKGKGR